MPTDPLWIRAAHVVRRGAAIDPSVASLGLRHADVSALRRASDDVAALIASDRAAVCLIDAPWPAIGDLVDRLMRAQPKVRRSVLEAGYAALKGKRPDPWSVVDFELRRFQPSLWIETRPFPVACVCRDGGGIALVKAGSQIKAEAMAFSSLGRDVAEVFPLRPGRSVSIVATDSPASGMASLVAATSPALAGRLGAAGQVASFWRDAEVLSDDMLSIRLAAGGLLDEPFGDRHRASFCAMALGRIPSAGLLMSAPVATIDAAIACWWWKGEPGLVDFFESGSFGGALKALRDSGHSAAAQDAMLASAAFTYSIQPYWNRSYDEPYYINGIRSWVHRAALLACAGERAYAEVAPTIGWPADPPVQPLARLRAVLAKARSKPIWLDLLRGKCPEDASTKLILPTSDVAGVLAGPRRTRAFASMRSNGGLLEFAFVEARRMLEAEAAFAEAGFPDGQAFAVDSLLPLDGSKMLFPGSAARDEQLVAKVAGLAPEVVSKPSPPASESARGFLRDSLMQFLPGSKEYDREEDWHVFARIVDLHGAEAIADFIGKPVAEVASYPRLARSLAAMFSGLPGQDREADRGEASRVVSRLEYASARVAHAVGGVLDPERRMVAWGNRYAALALFAVVLALPGLKVVKLDVDRLCNAFVRLRLGKFRSDLEVGDLGEIEAALRSAIEEAHSGKGFDALPWDVIASLMFQRLVPYHRLRKMNLPYEEDVTLMDELRRVLEWS